MSRPPCWFPAILLMAVTAVSMAGEGGPAPAPPNLLLITLDTTRADHLGCYGGKDAETPTLNGLAARGILLKDAHANVPLTLPSHAVILSGMLPSSLNLRVNGMQLKEGVDTLATILKRKGYWTGAAVGAVILERERGLARGFAVYDDHMTMAPRTGGPPEERAGGEVTDAALRAVQGAKGPYFLWVHYYDPHFEYRPPEPYASKFSARPYDGEIAYMDASIGRLLEGLRQGGRLDNTLIVVAGDHGESLGEHGEAHHGVFLYEATLHVPLLFAWEGHLPGGREIPGLVGLCDVAPTVLDLMGLPALKMDGRSLKAQFSGAKSPSPPLYAESYHGYFTYGWAPLRCIMTEDWKFIEAPKPELYRWWGGESVNEYKASDPRVLEARKLLKGFPPADEGEQAAMAKFLKDPSNAETLRQLMSLGYLSGGGVRSDASGLLDPKDVIGIEAEVGSAKQLCDGGETQKGVDILLGVLKRNPGNVPALSILGLAYLTSGELEKARVCFTEEVRLKPQMETAHLNLGTAYKKLGRFSEAEKEYRAALILSPRMPEAAANLAQLMVRGGRGDEAKAILDAALAAGAESADLYFELGVVEAGKSNWDRARFAFTKSVSLDPTKDEPLANLGRIAFQLGRIDEAIADYERASRIAPRNASYLATLGSLYLNGKGDVQKALLCYRRALAADPYGPEASNLKDIIRGLQSAPPS